MTPARKDRVRAVASIDKSRGIPEPFEVPKQTPTVPTRRSRAYWIGGSALLILIAAVSFPLWRPAQAPEATSFVVSQSQGKLITGGYSGWVGFRMTVGAAPVRVTELGRLMVQDNALTHTLKIVDAESGIDVPGAAAQVSMKGRQTGTFVYGGLPQPVTLRAGGSFLVVSSESVSNNKGDFFHDFDSRVEVTPVAAIDHAICMEGGTWRAYGKAKESFGPLSFRYVASTD